MLLGLLGFAVPAYSGTPDPAIDGTADSIYCTPPAVQDPQKEFVDNDDAANGSDSNQAFALIKDGALQFVPAGNLIVNRDLPRQPTGALRDTAIIALRCRLERRSAFVQIFGPFH